MEIAALESQADALSDTLHKALATGSGRCWLLIDTMQRPLQADLDFDAAILARDPLRAPEFDQEVDRRQMPWLLELDSTRAADSELIRQAIVEAEVERQPESLAQGAGRRICGWLESSVDGKALARHVSLQVTALRATGGKATLRWFDPAGLWAMWPLLEPDQRKTLLGPISTYWLLDPGGHWLPLRAGFDGETLPRLRLSAEQLVAIDDIRPLNAALREWGAAAADADALIAARQNGIAALRRARSLGFNDRRDLAAFARCALTVHSRFDQHPLLRERLAKREGDDYFTALIDDLTPEDWRRIRVECDAPPSGMPLNTP